MITAWAKVLPDHRNPLFTDEGRISVREGYAGFA